MTRKTKIIAPAAPIVSDDAFGIVHERDVAPPVSTCKRSRSICDDGKYRVQCDMPNRGTGTSDNNPTASLTRETKGAKPFSDGFPHSASESSCDEISRLYVALDRVNERTHPRTAQLLASGLPKMAQKMMEEAGELAIEAVRHRGRAVVRESADLLYNLVVLWRECGIAPGEIWAEMNQRANSLGIAEKLPKRPKA